jgi:hypothetical protein
MYSSLGKPAHKATVHVVSGIVPRSLDLICDSGIAMPA